MDFIIYHFLANGSLSAWLEFTVFKKRETNLRQRWVRFLVAQNKPFYLRKGLLGLFDQYLCLKDDFTGSWISGIRNFGHEDSAQGQSTSLKQ